MSTQTGSRDWLPSSCAAGGPRSLTPPAPAPNHALRAAALSAGFGLVALTMAVAPLIPSATTFRWIIGALGLTAVLWGVRAARQHEGRARLASAALTALGVGTGALATLGMVALLVAVQGSGLAGA